MHLKVTLRGKNCSIMFSTKLSTWNVRKKNHSLCFLPLIPLIVPVLVTSSDLNFAAVFSTTAM